MQNSSTLNRAPIIQSGAGNAKAQQWQLNSLGSGVFNLINVNSGKALANPDASLNDGTPLQQRTADSADLDQQWQFVDVGDGFYTVFNLTSGRVLDLRDGRVADGTTIQQWEAFEGDATQQWRVVLVA